VENCCRNPDRRNASMSQNKEILRIHLGKHVFLGIYHLEYE
jgi:hypothetical protein